MKANRVRWGLLSTARINERIMPAIRAAARSELVAVASQGGLEKAKTYANQWDIPRAYGRYEDLLADPDINAVYISLPNALHLEWTLKAAQAGKHILCEKPLALSGSDVDRMIDAASRSGIVLQEAVMMRYHPQTKDLQRRLAEGVIGDIRLIRGVFSFTLSRLGDIRFDPSLGGGSIWDLGSYPVNFMRTMLRENPIEVHAWRTSDRMDAGVDLSFAGQMRFPSGAVTQFFSSFQSAPQSDVDILGSAGRIQLDLPYLNKVGVDTTVRISRMVEKRATGTFSDSAEFIDETRTYRNVNAYQDEVDAMIASILDRAEPVVPLSDSRANAATLEALCKSARDGRPAPVNAVRHD